MDTEEAARSLGTLGHPTRLAIVKLLVRAGPAGLPVGEVQRRLDVPPSTLSHHIGHLVGAGLMYQKREGRILRCTPNFERLEALVAMLTEDCCRGLD